MSSVCIFRRQEKTIMKLVVHAETDKVLRASMCGPDALEIIQEQFFFRRSEFYHSSQLFLLVISLLSLSLCMTTIN